MASVLDLLNQSLLLCGMRASGETVDAALAQDALQVLHQMIDAWALDSLLVYQIARQVFPLQANVQTYTVGPGGTLNIPRPVQIPAVNWRNEANTPALELPLYPLDDQAYQRLAVRELGATIPTHFYYDQGYPLGLLFFWPMPTMAQQMVLWLWVRFDATQPLSALVAFPPGYERMLVYNLALELSAQPGARLSPLVARLAEESKHQLETFNAAPPVLALPGGLFGGHGRYNPLTDNQ